jgi:menaquinone-dependent protoporphyrinogen oxidase
VPRVLVLYGTTDGHTRKIAETLARTLADERCAAVVIDSDARDVPGPETFDGVVLAASVHGGNYQASVQRWVGQHAAELTRMPSAFLSVCLGILDRHPETRREAEQLMRRFCDRFGWEPAPMRAVAGALLYTRYNWLKRWMMKRIVAKAGGDTDTSRDYEYTDWAELQTLTRDFARGLWRNRPSPGIHSPVMAPDAASGRSFNGR